MATETNVQQETSGSSGEPPAVIPSPRDGHGALEVARRHPALTVAGAATLGLFGGFEVAAGIVIGAAMIALLRDGRERAAPAAAATHRVRDRARELWNDLPHTVRERTRAVLQAARGKPVDQPGSASMPSAD